MRAPQTAKSCRWSTTDFTRASSLGSLAVVSRAQSTPIPWPRGPFPTLTAAQGFHGSDYANSLNTVSGVGPHSWHWPRRGSHAAPRLDRMDPRLCCRSAQRRRQRSPKLLCISSDWAARALAHKMSWRRASAFPELSTRNSPFTRRSSTLAPPSTRQTWLGWRRPRSATRTAQALSPLVARGRSSNSHSS